MDAQLRALLDELHAEGASYDADKPDRLERRRNLEPATASLIALLVRASHARIVLELGTSNGYSTLWLADAVRSTRGGLVSVEIEATRSFEAGQNLDRAGLRSVVDLRVQDASQTLKESPAEFWDLIFLDAERSAYASYVPDLLRSIKRGGILLVDNVISHAVELIEFRALIDGDAELINVQVPVGAGLLLVTQDLIRQ